MVIDDRSETGATERRRFRPTQAGSVEIQPERERVRLLCAGALDSRIAAEVRQECEGLFDRGFHSVVLDLSRATSLGPAAISVIAAVDRQARGAGVRLSVVPGSGSVAMTLQRTGLLDRLTLEGPARVFMDWSR
jgi:anti-anti-sigma factor